MEFGVLEATESRNHAGVDREVSLEERGTEAHKFNAVIGAWLGACLFLRRSLQKISLQAALSHRLIASLWKACLSIVHA